MDIPEMYKYLPDNEDGEMGNGKGEEAYTGEEGKEETSQRIQKKEVFPSPIIITPQKIGIINKKDGMLVDDREPQISDPEKPKPRRTKSYKTPVDVHIRVFNSGHIKDVYEYTIILKSERQGKFDLRFYAIGEDDLSDKLQLLEISLIDGSKKGYFGNIIKHVVLMPKKEVRFTIKTKSIFKNAIKIELNELQQ